MSSPDTYSSGHPRRSDVVGSNDQTYMRNNTAQGMSPLFVHRNAAGMLSVDGEMRLQPLFCPQPVFGLDGQTVDAYVVNTSDEKGDLGIAVVNSKQFKYIVALLTEGEMDKYGFDKKEVVPAQSLVDTPHAGDKMYFAAIPLVVPQYFGFPTPEGTIDNDDALDSLTASGTGYRAWGELLQVCIDRSEAIEGAFTSEIKQGAQQYVANLPLEAEVTAHQFALVPQTKPSSAFPHQVQEIRRSYASPGTSHSLPVTPSGAQKLVIETHEDRLEKTTRTAGNNTLLMRYMAGSVDFDACTVTISPHHYQGLQYQSG